MSSRLERVQKERSIWKLANMTARANTSSQTNITSSNKKKLAKNHKYEKNETKTNIKEGNRGVQPVHSYTKHREDLIRSSFKTSCKRGKGSG